MFKHHKRFWRSLSSALFGVTGISSASPPRGWPISAAAPVALHRSPRVGDLPAPSSLEDRCRRHIQRPASLRAFFEVCHLSFHSLSGSAKTELYAGNQSGRSDSLQIRIESSRRAGAGSRTKFLEGKLYMGLRAEEGAPVGPATCKWSFTNPWRHPSSLQTYRHEIEIIDHSLQELAQLPDRRSLRPAPPAPAGQKQHHSYEHPQQAWGPVVLTRSRPQHCSFLGLGHHDLRPGSSRLSGGTSKPSSPPISPT